MREMTVGKLNLQEQTLPGAVGASLSVVWMAYGEWANIVPPDLGQGQELALTAALGVIFTALANMVRALLPGSATASPETTDPERKEPQ